MPVPDFQSLMLPVLKVLAGGREVSVSDVREHVAAFVHLTIDDSFSVARAPGRRELAGDSLARRPCSQCP